MAQQNPPVDIEWERRKLYLLQRFLGYRDDLSPVPEEPTVETDSCDPEGISSDLSPVPKEPIVQTESCIPQGLSSDDSSGSWSSLPSLIIEREPRRNKHDDPEEFYDELFSRMKKLYDHLFIHHRNYSSFDELQSEIEFGSASPQSAREDFFLEHQEGIQSSEEEEDMTDEDVVQAKKSSSKKVHGLEEFGSASPQSAGEDFLLEHQEGSRISDEEEDMTDKDVVQANKPPSKKVDVGSEDEAEFTFHLPELEERARGFSIREMEVMRDAHQGVNPEAQFSPPHTIISEAKRQLSPARASIRRERATTSCTPLEEAISEGDLADIPTCSSTPKVTKRKTTESGQESSKKKKKSEIWDDVFKNFFVGRPKVFGLVEHLPDSHQTSSSAEP